MKKLNWRIPEPTVATASYFMDYSRFDHIGSSSDEDDGLGMGDDEDMKHEYMRRLAMWHENGQPTPSSPRRRVRKLMEPSNVRRA